MTISVELAGVSGISSVSGTPGNAAKPLRHLRSRSMPPPLVGEALAFRDVFQQTQISFIENETSLPMAPLPGELLSGCETERLDKGRLSSERNNAGAALYNLSVIFASLDATSPSRGGFGIPSRFPANFNQSQQNDTSLSMAPLFRGAVERMRD